MKLISHAFIEHGLRPMPFKWHVVAGVAVFLGFLAVTAWGMKKEEEFSPFSEMERDKDA